MDLRFGRMKNLVGGEVVEAERGEWERVVDPATGEVIAEVPRCAEEDVDRAVEAASRAFEWWFETTPAERSEMLHGLADVLEEHAEELARLESRDVGKPITTARGELPYVVDNLRFFAGACRVMEGKAAGEYLRGYTSMIRREPVGVVGQIAPWNYPLMMRSGRLAPPWLRETPLFSNPPSRRP
jgi:acyl-CoA reductase-like NAD-dependent aldehyde dehydrogenase